MKHVDRRRLRLRRFSRSMVVLLASVELFAGALLAAEDPPSLDERAAALKILQQVRALNGSGALNPQPQDRFISVDLGRDKDHVIPLTEEMLMALIALPEMEWLRLSRTGVNDEQLARLPLSNMRYLSLVDTPISDRGLETLRTLEALEQLYLAKTAITGKGLEALAHIDALQDVGLDQTAVDDVALAHLARLPNLKRLSLNETGIGDAGLQQLANMRELEVLELNGTDVTDSGMVHLQALGKLRVLLLNRTAVSDAGIKQLAKLKGMMAIELASTRVGDESMKVCEGWPELMVLNLNHTMVSDEGVKSLRRLRKLSELYLGGTQITDAALRPLVDTELVKLSLADTAITKTALVYLQRQSWLRELNLSNTRIGDSSLEPLKHLPRLRSVDVSGTSVSPLDLLRSVPQTNPRVQAILRALGEPTELDFQAQPLCDVVEYLKQRHEIDIQLNYKSLRDAGVGTDVPITLRLGGVFLSEALEKVLEPLDLAFSVRHEVLFISAKPLPETAADFPIVPAGVRLSPTLAAAFVQPTELDFTEQPFKDVIAFLANKHRIPIEFDAKSMADAGIGFDVPVTRFVKGITLKSALELILPELDLVAVAEGEKVVIRTKPAR